MANQVSNYGEIDVETSSNSNSIELTALLAG